MKKIMLAVIMAAFLLVNSALADVTQLWNVSEVYSNNQVYSYTVTHTGSGGALTVHTPRTGNMVCIILVDWPAVAADTTITYYSGATAMLAQVLKADVGFTRTKWHCSAPSQAYKIDSDVAITGNVIIREQRGAWEDSN